MRNASWDINGPKSTPWTYWASPTSKPNNLRPLQQRNTLSMRISMFQVQYTLHWAGEARAPLAPPDELSRKKQARVD